MARVTIDSEIRDIINKHVLNEQDKRKLSNYIIQKTYFGSDLNEYVRRFLPIEFDLINLDVIRWKARDRHLLLAEYKHDDEGLAKSQKRIFPLLAFICKHTCNKAWDCAEHEPINIKSSIIVVRGNLPKTQEERQKLITENETIITIFDFDTKLERELTLIELDKLILCEQE